VERKKKSRKRHTRKWWCGMAGMVILLFFKYSKKNLATLLSMVQGKLGQNMMSQIGLLVYRIFGYENGEKWMRFGGGKNWVEA
jgi:hypothetical protein